MQIHKGHDQDIFGLMGKDSKIRVQQTLNLSPAGLSPAFGAWKRRVGTDLSVVHGELRIPESGIPIKVMFSSLITFLLLCNIGCCIYNRKEDKLKYCDKYLPTSCIPSKRLQSFQLICGLPQRLMIV